MGGEQNTWQPWYQRHSAQESERNKYMGSISKKITVQRKKDSNQADTVLKQLQASPTKQKRSILIEIFE